MNIINEKKFESINQEITEEQIMQEELDRFNQIKQSFIDNKTHNITNDVYYEDNNVSNKELIIEDKKDEIKSGDELIQKLTPTELIELEQKVEDAIKTIFDPEIPVNIWELGLIYDISITHSKEAVVLMTLTAPNCPEAGGIPIEVEKKVKEIPEILNCKAILTFEPAWDMSRMSEVAKFELGML
ncbi:MAG: iron-sulfur cluster assembly protein [Candidatus Kapaibacteriota bacterium]|jgi:FeS assembly SUF system protein